MARIPLPLTAADRAAGFWWQLSMRQVETSRTLVFDDHVHARTFFEALLCENMGLGRPENAGLLFRRGQKGGRPASPPPGGGFKTKTGRYCDLITLNVSCKNSRLKQYLKGGIALRIETVVNNPLDLGCDRLLHNLPDHQAHRHRRWAEGARTTVRRPSSPGPGRRHHRPAAHGHRHHQQEPARPDDQPAAPPLARHSLNPPPQATTPLPAVKLRTNVKGLAG